MDGTAPMIRLPDLPGQAVLLALSGTPPVIAAALTSGGLAVTGLNLSASRTLEPGGSKPLDLALSPDGALVAVAGERGLRIYRVADGTRVLECPFESAIRHARLSPDLTRVAVADPSGAIRLLDLANTNAVPRVFPSAGPVHVLRFTRSGQHLIVVGDDGNTRLYSVATLELVASTDQDGFVWHADFDESSGLLATANMDERARLFRLSPPPTSLPTLLVGLTPGAVLPAQRALVSLDMKGHVVTLQPAAGSALVRTQAMVAGGTVITATSKPEPTAFVGDAQGSVWRVPLNHQQPPQRLFDGLAPRRTIAVTTDGRWLAAGETNRLTLAQLDRGRVLTLTTFALPGIWSLVFSPQGDRLAVGCFAGQVAVLSTADRQATWSSAAHRGPVFAFAFSPDGRQLASASGDQSVRLWDAATGGELTQPLGHDDEVYSVAFDPGGTRLATGSKSQVVLWDLATRAELARFPLPPERVATVAFSPDGTRLLGANNSGRLAVWDLSVPFRVHDWDLSVPGGLPASRSRAAWLDPHRVVAWSMSGIVRFIDLPAAPRTELVLDLAEWITGQAVTAAGAVSRLSDAERAQRFSRLETAAERGELPPALARHLTHP
jgi:WD40 repeat protein